MISSHVRYDHFDTTPYMGRRAESRAPINIPFSGPACQPMAANFAYFSAIMERMTSSILSATAMKSASR